MELLLESEFDPNGTNQFGNTPLMESALAFEQNQSDLIKILNLHSQLPSDKFELGKSLKQTNKMGKNFLNILAIRNFSNVLRNILEASNSKDREEYLNQVDPGGWNLFSEAVFHGSYEVVKCFVDANYVKKEWLDFESRNYGNLVDMCQYGLEYGRPNSQLLKLIIFNQFEKFNLEAKQSSKKVMARKAH